jgi:hypothetical protein
LINGGACGIARRSRWIAMSGQASLETLGRRDSGHDGGARFHPRKWRRGYPRWYGRVGDRGSRWVAMCGRSRLELLGGRGRRSDGGAEWHPRWCHRGQRWRGWRGVDGGRRGFGCIFKNGGQLAQCKEMAWGWSRERRVGKRILEGVEEGLGSVRGSISRGCGGKFTPVGEKFSSATNASAFRFRDVEPVAAIVFQGRA